MLRRTPVFLLLVGCLAQPALAQLPPGLPVPAENFAALHNFGAVSVVDMRHMGMGHACVADDRTGWHSNPAGMVAVRRPTAEVHFMEAPFERIPDVDRLAMGFAWTGGAADTYKLLSVWTDANGATNLLPGAATLDATERDLSIEWAHRFNPKLSVGVGTAYLAPQTTFTIKPYGAVTRLRSHPIFPGGRIGAIYRTSGNTSVGFTYDNYTERVTQEVPAFRLPDVTANFHITGWQVGGGWWPDDRTMILVDYVEKKMVGWNVVVPTRAWMGGVERMIGRVGLRAGSYDGKLTAGIGYNSGGWDVSYAFSGKNDIDLEGMGGTTSHSFRVAHTF